MVGDGNICGWITHGQFHGFGPSRYWDTVTYLDANFKFVTSLGGLPFQRIIFDDILVVPTAHRTTYRRRHAHASPQPYIYLLCQFRSAPEVHNSAVAFAADTETQQKLPSQIGM